jgi:hypothetical protein
MACRFVPSEQTERQLAKLLPSLQICSAEEKAGIDSVSNQLAKALSAFASGKMGIIHGADAVSTAWNKLSSMQFVSKPNQRALAEIASAIEKENMQLESVKSSQPYMSLQRRMVHVASNGRLLHRQ